MLKAKEALVQGVSPIIVDNTNIKVDDFRQYITMVCWNFVRMRCGFDFIFSYLNRRLNTTITWK